MHDRSSPQDQSEAIEIEKIIEEFLNQQRAESSIAMPPINLLASLHSRTERVDIDHLYSEPDKGAANGRVVTVFLCGTCANQQDHANPRFFAGENISQTFTITEGVNNVDKLIVDGPGSGEKDADALWVPYKRYSDLAGMALGSGISERIEHILAVLKNKPTRELSATDKEVSSQLPKINQERPITRINIVGWSRGAAAGITLANRMANDDELKHIELNMVLLDPVPGAGVAMVFQNKLPEQVKNCYVIYAEDERSAFFNPVIPDCPAGCNYVPIVMPGGHAQIAGDDADHEGKKIESANLKGVGIVARYMMQHLLQQLGTRLDESKMSKMTLKDLLGHYDTIVQNRESYRKIAQRVAYVKFNQLVGEHRKVIDGNSKVTNQYFSDVREKRFPPHEGEYLDYTHQRLMMVTRRASDIVAEFDRLTEAVMQSSADFDGGKIQAILDRLLANPELQNAPLLCRSVSEEIQTRYKPADLQNIQNRCHTKAELEAYATKLLQELANLHSRQRNMEKAQKKNAAGCQQIQQDTKNQLVRSESVMTKLDLLPGQVKQRNENYKAGTHDQIESGYQDLKSTQLLLDQAEIKNVKTRSNQIRIKVSRYNDECDRYDASCRQTQHSMIAIMVRLEPEVNPLEAAAAFREYDRQMAMFDAEHARLTAVKDRLARELRGLIPAVEKINTHCSSLHTLQRNLEATQKNLQFTSESTQECDRLIDSMNGDIDWLRRQIALVKRGVTDSIKEINASCEPRPNINASANLSVEELKPRAVEEEARLKTLSELDDSLKERKDQLLGVKGSFAKTVSSANECGRILNEYLNADVSVLMSKVKAATAGVESTIKQFNDLQQAMKNVVPVSQAWRDDISALRGILTGHTTGIKNQLVMLLSQEIRRIQQDVQKLFSGNNGTKTDSKLQALQMALTRARQVSGIEQIAEIVNSLLQDNAVMCNRRRCDSLLNMFSIIGNPSTLAGNLRTFARQHKLERQPLEQQEIRHGIRIAP